MVSHTIREYVHIYSTVRKRYVSIDTVVNTHIKYICIILYAHMHLYMYERMSAVWYQIGRNL